MTITITRKLTGHEGVVSCLPGARLTCTGVSHAPDVPQSTVVMRARVSERPTQALAVAAQAQAGVYAFAAPGAGNQLFGQQKTQLLSMWALRGLNPWSDPA